MAQIFTDAKGHEVLVLRTFPGLAYGLPPRVQGWCERCGREVTRPVDERQRDLFAVEDVGR